MWGYGRGGRGSLSKTKAHLQVAFFHLQEFASCFSCMNVCVCGASVCVYVRMYVDTDVCVCKHVFWGGEVGRGVL